jgi:hypothetical protein
MIDTTLRAACAALRDAETGRRNRSMRVATLEANVHAIVAM